MTQSLRLLQPGCIALLVFGRAIVACAGAPVPAAASPACHQVPGLGEILASHDVVLVGEMHGTVESPGFLSSTACLAVQSGRSVTVALEVPNEEDARLQRYLVSPGSAADRAALLAGAFWQSSYQDGRRSGAMLGLLDALRRLRGGGAPLRVTLIDAIPEPPLTGPARDRAMATRLEKAMAAAPKDLFLVLTGNIHSRIGRGTPWEKGYEPMGFVLSRLAPGSRLAALDVQYTGGTAWFCLGEQAATCAAHEVRGNAPPAAPPVTQLAHASPEGYNGFYFVGRLTASPPAAGLADDASPDARIAPRSDSGVHLRRAQAAMRRGYPIEN